MLDGTGYEAHLDKACLHRIKEHFAVLRPRYQAFMSNIIGVETDIFDSQIPGGMISNMESQLKQQGAADRLEEVFIEVPRVREDAGFPPLVTPSSQIVGTQAVFNVLMGRYKVLSSEFSDLMLGYYGKTPGERDPEVLALAEAQAKKPVITERPADLLKPEWEVLQTAAAALPGFNGSEEDVLTYAMFPQVSATFFAKRDQGPLNLGRDPDAAKPATDGKAAASDDKALRTPVTYDVKLNGRSHRVSVTPINPASA
jgi:methylmalonyl-CoA carboxyltransferase 5S subunit